LVLVVIPTVKLNTTASRLIAYIRKSCTVCVRPEEGENPSYAWYMPGLMSIN
jgi:hypothetical protein